MSAITSSSAGLMDEDLLWLFEVGEEKIVGPGTAIVHEGVRPNAIFIAIRGAFSVGVESVAEEPLARLGAGELIGEIAFLEGSPASATIVAEEESAVLAVDHRRLAERIRGDTAFAARLYRAFALVAERRLRDRVDRLSFRFDFENDFAGPRSLCMPAFP